MSRLRLIRKSRKQRSGPGALLGLSPGPVIKRQLSPPHPYGKYSRGEAMPARFSELVISLAVMVAMLFAMLIIPAIERSHEKARKDSWRIIDREFLEGMGEESNG